jgi:hypothetical protein
MRYKTRNDFETYLILKAWEDPNFLSELRNNPKAVLARELNTEPLPEQLDVEVLEETPNKLYLVLPSRPDPESMGQALASRAFAAVSRDELDQIVADWRHQFTIEFCWSE